MSSPLHERLYDDLAARIRDGVWPQGAGIPSETRLCAEFGVSRGPVRQALARLRAEGLLVGGQGRPPRVARGVVPSQPVNVFVSFSAWATAAGLEPGQRTITIARTLADDLCAAALGISSGDPVVSLLRLRTLSGEPVMLERTWWVEAVGRHLFEVDTDAGSTYAHLAAQGVDLFAATHVIDAVGADAVDAEHLAVPPGSPLLRERRTTVDSSGVILEHAEDRYLPGRANFVVHNHRAGQGPLALIDPASVGSEQPARSA